MKLTLIRRVCVVAVAGLAASGLTAAAATASPARTTARTAPGLVAGHDGLALVSAPARTPIKHVVVIIGENHTFDNVFATYQPPGHQKIRNLLSEGIVTKSGTAGPNFGQARQLTASNTKTYSLNPKITGSYKPLPQPNTTYV